MSKEVIAGLVAASALMLAAVIKGCFDIWMKKADLRAGEKREEKDELDAMREERDKARLEADEWRGKYWIEYERRIAEKVTIIGSPLEIEQHKRALDTYKQTVEQDIKSYLEIDERK